MQRVSQQRGVIMVVQAQLVAFAVLGQLFTSLPFQALGRSPQYSSDHLILPSSNGVSNGASTGSGESLHRALFPKDFIFGVGTSAYQVEGGVSEGGKGISIWDTWAHGPGHIPRGDNGDVAVDHYNRFEEDIDLIAEMNMDSYRFSISWTRIFPNGTGPDVNTEGVSHYNRVIDALLSKGLKPFVTLFHWDLPQALQDSYAGWSSHQSVGDFAAYAEACFAAFGDRVKHWVTFNEPGQFLHGYGCSHKLPPGRDDNPSTGSYLAAHNVLLAHAAAVDIYRRVFQEEQKGEIGITVDSQWGEPLTNSSADFEAAQRNAIFQLGWFLDPLFFGDYPAVMREILSIRLPEFCPDQVSLVQGSLDFIGLNHYTTRWVTKGPGPSPEDTGDFELDQHVQFSDFRDGVEIGPSANSPWLLMVPWGMHRVLKWTWERYAAPIFVTENGMDYNSDMPVEDLVHDGTRIQFHHNYMSAVLQAIGKGVDVRGYYAWSLLDNFEWAHGYENRFGLIYIDFNDGLKRYPKDSASWFTQVLKQTWSDL